MSGFITSALSTNKDLYKVLYIIVLGNWEFGAFELSGLSSVPRVHGVLGIARFHFDLFFLFLFVDFCDDVRIGWCRDGGY